VSRAADPDSEGTKVYSFAPTAWNCCLLCGAAPDSQWRAGGEALHQLLFLVVKSHSCIQKTEEYRRRSRSDTGEPGTGDVSSSTKLVQATSFTFVRRQLAGATFHLRGLVDSCFLASIHRAGNLASPMCITRLFN